MIIFRIASAGLASITLAAGFSQPPRKLSAWCVQIWCNDGNNGTTGAFTSFEQCMMTARGGVCVENPWNLATGSGQKRAESA